MCAENKLTYNSNIKNMHLKPIIKYKIIIGIIQKCKDNELKRKK